MMKIYIDGELFPENQAKISVLDHGLLYGDGVFEGIRAYHGRIFRLKEHLLRLQESAQIIHLEVPHSEDQLIQAIIETLQANQLKDAYIRLIVTRGVGDLGLDPEKCSSPSVIVITTGISIYPREFYEKGMKLITSSVRRVPSDVLSPQAKTLNYLNNILAKIEAQNAGVVEAVMLNSNGYVVECTADNIFVLKENQK